MKTYFKVKYFLLISILFLSKSCELFTDDETDKVCSDNSLFGKITMPVQYIIQISSYLDYPTAEHKVSNATELTFQGYIRKINCNGGEGGYVKLNHTIYPSENKNSLNFNVGPSNSFVFSNKRDYMSITYSMKMKFSDGRSYQSEEVTENSERFENFTISNKPIVIFLTRAVQWTVITI